MNKNNLSGQKISKKEAKVLIYKKLAGALSEYKGSIKAKKFETKLKKASRLFASDIAKATIKNNDTPKKNQKKQAKSKVQETHKEEIVS